MNRATETNLLYSLAKEYIKESLVSSIIPSSRKLDFSSKVRVCGIMGLKRFEYEVWHIAGRWENRDLGGLL
jgi:hypothetical protein